MPDTHVLSSALEHARKSASAIASTDADGWRSRWNVAAEAGLLNFTVPVELGGGGGSAEAHVNMMMELGRLVPDNGLTLGLGTHIWTVQQPLVTFGTDAQRATYLPDLNAGRRIGAYALTGPESGSDAMGLQTRAERDGEHYILNGEKTYIGMGPCFDVALVFASTAPERKSWDVSVFLVEGDDPGVTRGPVQEKLGLKTLPTGKVSFDNCRISASRRLGPEGSGARIFQATLDWERAFILAAHVGAMARQLDESAAFAKSRQTFGKPILEHQSVSNRIADMRIRYATARLILLNAAAEYDGGKLQSDMAAIVNLHISEAFLASSIDSMRNLGGAGYLTGSQAGTDITDALGGVIYSGTSDVERQIVAKMTAQKSGRDT